MDTIRNLTHRLSREFGASHVELIDESGQHAGHAGAIPGHVTHVRAVIVSDMFEGLTRIERHRRVYAVLAADLRGTLHALTLQALTDKEYRARQMT